MNDRRANPPKPSHLATRPCARIEHNDSHCFCDTHRCDGWCHRNCGYRCGYHLGHSETDWGGTGVEGSHCCCPNHSEVWVDPSGRTVPIEGTPVQDLSIYRRTPSEQEIQRAGRLWNTGNLYPHVQQDRDIARARRTARQRSRSGSSNRGARSASQGSNNRGRSGSVNFRSNR